MELPVPFGALLVAAVGGLREDFQDIVEGEAADMLARRELLERLQELSDVGLGAVEHEGVLDAPARIVDGFVVADLERVHAKIENLWQAQRDERFLPHQITISALFLEDDLPVLIAQADERA